MSFELYRHDINFLSDSITAIAGVDEAGRGPLAGPVVAAAVILNLKDPIELINDSKKLSPKKRDLAFDLIKDKAIAIGVGVVDHRVIDDINILNATKQAMKEAISKLKLSPSLLLIDAVSLSDITLTQKAIIKGDSLSASIAAASIIAKVTRDRLMEEYDRAYPLYRFAKHKGYPTKEHIALLKSNGPCPIHRLTFSPVSQLVNKS